MKLNKLYQSSFHNVLFKEHDDLKLSLKQLPDGSFYKILYEKIQKTKYIIPNSFINSKVDNARIICDTINKYLHLSSNVKILSWGAGLGIVESEIYSKFDVNVTAIETVCDDTFWNSNVKYFSNLNEIKEDKSFDIFLVVSALYSMNDDALIKFLDKAKNFLKKDGLFIFYEQAPLSIYTALKVELKLFIKSILNIKQNEQLWGFLRSPDEFIKLFEKSGIKLKEINFFDGIGVQENPYVEMKISSLKQPLFKRRYRSMIFVGGKKIERK